MTSQVPVLPKEKILDFKNALDIVKSEYTERDGIDVQTLLDSKTNGGLTYNDFLVLPGYIGMSHH
jgi:IMP dehydrogenase